jgi:hypothetical protein
MTSVPDLLMLLFVSSLYVSLLDAQSGDLARRLVLCFHVHTC